MSTGEVISLGSFLLAAVAAILSLWQAGIASRARAAQAARDSAAEHEQAAPTAARDAAEAAQRSADEHKRTADALEEQVALARAQVVPPAVRWEPFHVDGSRWAVENTGNTTAGGAIVTEPPEHPNRITPDTDQQTDVEQGERMSFLARGDWGMTTVLRITWTDPDGTARQRDWRLLAEIATPL